MKYSRRSVVVATCLLMLAARPQFLRGQETSEQVFIQSVDRIWDRAGHSAFTDLLARGNTLYCAFREGTGHIPGQNGVIRILRSDDAMNWRSVAVLAEKQVDLRDPKLSLTPDDRIMVSMGASYYEGSERKAIESRVAFSTNADATSFGAPQKVIFTADVLTGLDWLWRVTWHGDTAWGCLQQVPDREHRSLRLVKSRDGIHYDVVTKLEVDGANETTLRFLPDESLLAMIRRDGSERSGHIGIAKPPYTEWKFTPSNERFGGPNLVRLPNGAWLAGSRDYEGKPTTQVWSLDPATAQFRHLVTLPSGGDTSYPGFVLDEPGNRLLMSYYSSHEGKAAIYLATLRLDELVKATSAK